MPTPEKSRSELTRDLALKIIALAETEQASTTVFFTALGMAYLSSVIGLRTGAGQDVEEADLAQAINKFSDVLCDQASWLIGVQPQVLKAETETLASEQASQPQKGIILL